MSRRRPRGRTASIEREPVQIVYTPGSGDGGAMALASRIARAVRRRGHVARIDAFKKLRDLAAWSAACDGGFSRLICIGGDATVSAAAPAAMRHEVPFLPVPSGFGNLFASAFEMPEDPRGALDVLSGGAVRRVDVGLAGDEVFLCHSSYGLLANVQKAAERSRRQPQERWRRHLGYYKMARKILFEASLPSIRVEADGRLLARDAVIATVANVETYRGFLSLTPDASPMDGWFDVVVMERASRPRVWARLIGLLLGFSDVQAGIRRCRARQVRVREDGRKLEEVRMLPAALPLLVPAAVAATLPVTRPGATRRLGLVRGAAPRQWQPAPARSTPPGALGAAG